MTTRDQQIVESLVQIDQNLRALRQGQRVLQEENRKMTAAYENKSTLLSTLLSALEPTRLDRILRKLDQQEEELGKHLKRALEHEKAIWEVTDLTRETSSRLMTDSRERERDREERIAYMKWLRRPTMVVAAIMIVLLGLLFLRDFRRSRVTHVVLEEKGRVEERLDIETRTTKMLADRLDRAQEQSAILEGMTDKERVHYDSIIECLKTRREDQKSKKVCVRPPR